MNHLEDALKAIDRLDPFPQTALRVLELAQNNASPEQLVSTIEKDPGLTAQVLKLANSAQQGSRVGIDSLSKATTRLGLRAVANLALTSGCSALFQGAGTSAARINESLWTESLHNAIHSRRLALRDGRLDPELAYTVGLLQNIGHIVLDRFFSDELEEINRERQGGKDMLSAERSVLGIDHAQCGALMVRRWGLPRSIIRGVQFHHAASKAGEEELLCAVCGMAEDLAARWLANGAGTMTYPVDGGGVGVQWPGDAEMEDLNAEVRQEVAASQE